MKTEKYSSRILKQLLKENKVCTLNEFMKALGTKARITVMRKLSELKYQTSYSHSGKYYTLKSTCKFNEIGLWSFRKAWFSKDESLIKTICNLIEESEAGYSNSELDKILHVETRLTLIQLFNSGKISREKYSGVYIYFSTNEQRRRRQIVFRNEDCTIALGDKLLGHELKAAIVIFFSLLNEQQRRVFAGLESLKLGKGGDNLVARILGIDSHTVAKGRIELQDHDLEIDRTRREGGGRPMIKKKRLK